MNKLYICLIIIPFLLIIFNMLNKNSSYIGLHRIIKEHFSLFKNNKYQYLVFFVYPLLISVGIAMLTNPTDTIIEQENVVISILISALLALLGILVSKDYEGIPEDFLVKIKKIRNETNNAIMVSVCIGIVIMILNFIFLSVSIDSMILKRLFIGSNFYLFIVMLLTILLIIKRVGNLIDIK